MKETSRGDLAVDTGGIEPALETERQRGIDAKPKMLLTPKQQAEQAGISRRQVRSLITSGKLPTS